MQHRLGNALLATYRLVQLTIDDLDTTPRGKLEYITFKIILLASGINGPEIPCRKPAWSLL